MVEIDIKQCKKCSNKHLYVCPNCVMGGCSSEGCDYQGVRYKGGGLFSSGGGRCMRCDTLSQEV